MTKKEVAELLGISEKSVENWRDKGHLTQTMVPGKTRPVAQFDEREVESLKLHIESRKPEPRISKVESRMTNVQTSNAESRIVPIPRTSNIETPNVQGVQIYAVSKEQLEELLGQGSALQELAVKTILTFQEASRFTGIPEKRLRDAAKAGDLITTNSLGRAAKMLRSDLDAFVVSQFPKRA